MGYGPRKKVDPAEKQQEKFYAILETLLKEPGNEICADCTTKGPRWASVNLGIFVCIRCSGIHRHMGTHISKVRSVSLDKWLPEHIEMMQKMGNAKARRIYEGRLPANYRRPSEHDTHGVEQWIRDKYDRKIFYDAAAAAAFEAEAQNRRAAPAPQQQRQPSSTASQNRPKRKLSGHNQSLPASRQQQAPVPSLIDASIPAPSPTQQTQRPPAVSTPPAGWSTPGAVQVSTGGEDFFSDFVSAPAAVSANGQQTGSFFDTQPQPQVQQQAVQQPKASKDDILSLFKNQSTSPQQMGNGMGMGMGVTAMGMGQQQMGAMGMGMGMNQMGMNQMGMNQMGMNQMGMNQMGMNQMGMNQMGVNQMGMNQMGTNQMGMGMNQMGMSNQMGMGMGMQQQPQQSNFGFQSYPQQQQQSQNPFGF